MPKSESRVKQQEHQQQHHSGIPTRRLAQRNRMQQADRLQWHIPWEKLRKRIPTKSQDRVLYVVTAIVIVLTLNSKIGYQVRHKGKAGAVRRQEYIPFTKVLKTNFLLQEQIATLTEELRESRSTNDTLMCKLQEIEQRNDMLGKQTIQLAETVKQETMIVKEQKATMKSIIAKIEVTNKNQVELKHENVTLLLELTEAKKEIERLNTQNTKEEIYDRSLVEENCSNVIKQEDIQEHSIDMSIAENSDELSTGVNIINIEQLNKDRKKLSNNKVINTAEPDIADIALVETGVKTRSVETNNRHIFPGPEVVIDEGSVSTQDSFNTEFSKSFLSDEWDNETTLAGDSTVAIPRDSLTNSYLFGATKVETNTAWDYRDKKDIEERLWQFIYSTGYEAEFNSNVKQWRQDLCNVVEGK